jgi:hypothetical protein
MVVHPISEIVPVKGVTWSDDLRRLGAWRKIAAWRTGRISGGTDSMEIPRTMKATVLVAPHRFELLERPVPVAGDEDVLVRVRACGV